MWSLTWGQTMKSFVWSELSSYVYMYIMNIRSVDVESKCGLVLSWTLKRDSLNYQNHWKGRDSFLYIISSTLLQSPKVVTMQCSTKLTALSAVHNIVDHVSCQAISVKINRAKRRLIQCSQLQGSLTSQRDVVMLYVYCAVGHWTWEKPVSSVSLA